MPPASSPSAHEVFRYVSDSASMMFSGGGLKVKEAGSSAGFAVRALVDGRLGFAHCQQEHGLRKALEDAGKASRFSQKTRFSFAPKPPACPSPDVFDPGLDPGDFETAKSLVDEARSAAGSKGGKPRVILSLDRYGVEIENTAGFLGRYRKTGASVYVECMHGDGFGFSYLSSCKKPRETASAGRKAAEMAKAMQGASRPESGTYTVVFELEALQSLMETLLPSFSGDWKRRRMTKLEMGKRMFSERLTICDDALAQPGSAARPFDDEGTPSRRRVLVERGTVRSFLYDRETAALAREDGSGACARAGYDAPPSIGASNIVVSPGTWKDFGGLGKHVELHYAHGAHTANATTGDIGLEASVAFLVEREGRERKPLKGFMLTGNVFDMFAGMEAVEKEQRVYDNLIAPRIAFKNVRLVS